LAQRVLAIPNKRFDRRPIEYLTQPEIEALLSAPNRATWGGRRDYALLLVASQTGLRISELIGLRCDDVVLGAGGSVRCRGKGRKERSTPLRRDVVVALRSWLRERLGGPPLTLCFPARGAGHSAVMALSVSWPSMSPTRENSAPRWLRNAFRCMCCGTPSLWICSSRVWTAR
jgi:integrase